MMMNEQQSNSVSEENKKDAFWSWSEYRFYSIKSKVFRSHEITTEQRKTDHPWR